MYMCKYCLTTCTMYTWMSTVLLPFQRKKHHFFLLCIVSPASICTMYVYSAFITYAKWQ